MPTREEKKPEALSHEQLVEAHHALHESHQRLLAAHELLKQEHEKRIAALEKQALPNIEHIAHQASQHAIAHMNKQLHRTFGHSGEPVRGDEG